MDWQQPSKLQYVGSSPTQGTSRCVGSPMDKRRCVVAADDVGSSPTLHPICPCSSMDRTLGFDPRDMCSNHIEDTI